LHTELYWHIFWNQQLFPWDDDIDVQMTISDLSQICTQYNGTIFLRRYLFDCNPHLFWRQHQEENVIDARFIDTHNGLFIDITGLSQSKTKSRIVKKEVHCKSPHYYEISDIFPLHYTLLNGISVFRPHNVLKILKKEYSEAAMQNTVWVNTAWGNEIWEFNKKGESWELKNPHKKKPKKKKQGKKAGNGQISFNVTASISQNLSWKMERYRNTKKIRKKAELNSRKF